MSDSIRDMLVKAAASVHAYQPPPLAVAAIDHGDVVELRSFGVPLALINPSDYRRMLDYAAAGSGTARKR